MLETAAVLVVPAQLKMAGVKRSFIDSWIARRVNEILGFEDEVVIGLIVNTLDAEVCCGRGYCAAATRWP